MGCLPAKVGAPKHRRAAVPWPHAAKSGAGSPARRHGTAAAEGVAVQAAAGSKWIVLGELLVLQLGWVGAWPIAGIQPLHTILSESPAECGQHLLQGVQAGLALVSLVRCTTLRDMLQLARGNSCQGKPRIIEGKPHICC